MLEVGEEVFSNERRFSFEIERIVDQLKSTTERHPRGGEGGVLRLGELTEARAGRERPLKQARGFTVDDSKVHLP